MAQDADTSLRHTIEFDDADLALERADVEERIAAALHAHRDLQSAPSEQREVVRKVYDQACAQLVPVRHLLLQVAA